MYICVILMYVSLIANMYQVHAGCRELLVRDRLQRPVRAHRDEPRGLDDAVRGVDAPDRSQLYPSSIQLHATRTMRCHLES